MFIATCHLGCQQLSTLLWTLCSGEAASKSGRRLVSVQADAAGVVEMANHCRMDQTNTLTSRSLSPDSDTLPVGWRRVPDPVTSRHTARARARSMIQNRRRAEAGDNITRGSSMWMGLAPPHHQSGKDLLSGLGWSGGGTHGTPEDAHQNNDKDRTPRTYIIIGGKFIKMASITVVDPATSHHQHALGMAANT